MGRKLPSIPDFQDLDKILRATTRERDRLMPTLARLRTICWDGGRQPVGTSAIAVLAALWAVVANSHAGVNQFGWAMGRLAFASVAKFDAATPTNGPVLGAGPLVVAGQWAGPRY